MPYNHTIINVILKTTKIKKKPQNGNPLHCDIVKGNKIALNYVVV